MKTSAVLAVVFSVIRRRERERKREATKQASAIGPLSSVAVLLLAGMREKIMKRQYICRYIVVTRTQRGAE